MSRGGGIAWRGGGGLCPVAMAFGVSGDGVLVVRELGQVRWKVQASEGRSMVGSDGVEVVGVER